MNSTRSLLRIAWTVPVLVAFPFLTGADGPGCGGFVAIGSGAGSDGGSSGGGIGVDGGIPSDSATTCTCTGPGPSAPNFRCSDGSLGGPVCGQHPDGTCSWEIRSCPPVSDACPRLPCPGPCPAGYLIDSNGCSTCQCAPVPDASGPCASDADCGKGYVCGFLESEGCAAAGACFAMQTGPVCLAYAAGCACDGSEVNLACNGYPNGYAAKPLLHSGVCTDAGASGLKWYWTCGDPVCQVPESDAGLTDDAGAPCPPVGSSCSPNGETCGTRTASAHCGAVEICDNHNPAVNCPISSRRFKDGIEYVDDEGLEKLHDETLRIQLATYNYKSEVCDPSPRHLGFIIEDMPQSPAVEPGQSHVDMYGYVSMVVAAMQVQEKEIAELRRELDRARAGVCEDTKRSPR